MKTMRLGLVNFHFPLSIIIKMNVINNATKRLRGYDVCKNLLKWRTSRPAGSVTWKLNGLFGPQHCLLIVSLD